jgi:hypothetical protein
MTTFAKMAVWPTGYFRAYSSWLLRNRRDVVTQISTISAEIQRIGFITVSYQTAEVNGQQRATEQRVGFGVTTGSSLARLCQAYIANGGNPLDISPFAYPDGIEIVGENGNGEPIVIERYPHGGVAAPISVESSNPGGKPNGTGYEGYEGGWLRTDRYYPARQNGRRDRGAFDSDSIVRHMHAIRGWANQIIKERLQNIEWQIIKLCDLREQLVTERDEILIQAFGGTLNGLDDFDEARFSRGLRVQSLVTDIQDLIYENDAAKQSFRPSVQIGFLDFTFPDAVSEDREPLGC